MYASVKPEEIVEVTAPLRDQWILETIGRTKERIEAVKEGSSMDTVTKDELIKLGFNKPVADGVSLAFEHYDRMLVEKYVQMLQDALDYVSMGEHGDASSSAFTQNPSQANTASSAKKTVLPAETDEKDEEAEKIVLDVIKTHEGEDGVSWDVITEACKKEGLDDTRVDETLNSLMDKGLIYEPVLGTIKST
jgi:hypothetical protein